MNQKTKVACWVLLALAVLAIISAFVVVSPGPHPIARTKLMLAICNDELSLSPDLFERIDGQTKGGWKLDSIHVNELLAEKLSKNTNQAIWMSFREQHPHVLVDAWGEPLMFMLRGANDVRFFGGILRQTNSMLVWSSGPDRVNEFGAGDDVVP